MVAVASVQSRVLSLERPSQARGRRHGCSVQQRRLVVRAAKTEPMEDVPFSSHNGASNAGRTLTSTIENIESWHQYNAQHPEEFKYGYDDRAHSWPKDKGTWADWKADLDGALKDAVPEKFGIGSKVLNVAFPLWAIFCFFTHQSYELQYGSAMLYVAAHFTLEYIADRPYE
mmetsp:Transcript_10254/g.37773  ORF Transcript_10254/g.37773 Transcript_10254/m.37773 type:complete len:172 (-) Transcript_10254:1260-1775(-)